MKLWIFFLILTKSFISHVPSWQYQKSSKPDRGKARKNFLAFLKARAFLGRMQIGFSFKYHLQEEVFKWVFKGKAVTVRRRQKSRFTSVWFCIDCGPSISKPAKCLDGPLDQWELAVPPKIWLQAAQTTQTSQAAYIYTPPWYHKIT